MKSRIDMRRRPSPGEQWHEMVEQYGLWRAIAMMTFGPIFLFSLALLLKMSIGIVLVLAWHFVRWLVSLL